MRVYRLLIRLCPAPVRHEWGAAMEETLARRLADARAGGALRRAQVWTREAAGVVALAVSERWGAAARRRRRNGPFGRKAGRMDGLSREIRHAARRLVRSPAFTAATVLTLGLAIGANASIFAVVQRVVLNPLPYPDSDRLVSLDHGAPGLNATAGMGMTSGLYFLYRDRARTVESVALYWAFELTLTGEGDPERIRVSRTTPSLATVLRTQPALGRWFTEEEGVPGARQVAILSHGLWQRRYGGDGGVLGRSVTLSGVPTEVIGVMPQGFAFPDPRVDVWMPGQFSLETARAGGFNFSGVGRLRGDATVVDARAEMNTLIAGLAEAYPNDPFAESIVNDARLQSATVSLKEATVGRVATTLWILLASVGLVLLIACANVANLFLVRSEARQREVAVRHALGAGRRGVARYFLTESALLSIAGGAIGLVLAVFAVRALVAFGPQNLPRLEEVRVDGVAVAFTLAVSMLAAIAFGALPLLRSTSLASALHESGRGNTASRRRHRTRQLLMGGQIALALVLLTASALMVRSFQTLRALDPGFDATSALTFRIGLPSRDYPSRSEAAAAHLALVDRIAGLPGVTAVSTSTCLPLAEERYCYGDPLLVQGRPFEEGRIPPIVAFRAVGPDYFDAMGIPVQRGRGIDRAALQSDERIAVVNEALADVYFPGQDPIGARVTMDFLDENPTWLTIVGVVSNTPTIALGEATPVPQLFMPMFSGVNTGPDIQLMAYVVRTATPPLGSVAAIRRAAGEVDPNLALAQVRTLEDTLDRASEQMAFTMVLLAIAASVALLLGLIGIYGVVSYIVSQRTGEIGVRLALGAQPGGVAGMILRQGGFVATAGIAVGLIAALAGSRLIESLLYGISPRDPGVFAATTLALLLVALLACWVPALRAARLSPVEALRTE